MNDQTVRRVRKKLIVFYAILASILSVFAVVTGLFWHTFEYQQANDYQDTWQVSYCKLCPCGLVLLFGVFNVWIQCSNKQISRQIIHPWITCRCHLYIFLFVLPVTLTTLEIMGIVFYV